MGGAAIEAGEMRAAQEKGDYCYKRKGRIFTCIICKGQYKHQKMAKTGYHVREICKKCLKFRTAVYVFRFKVFDL